MKAERTDDSDREMVLKCSADMGGGMDCVQGYEPTVGSHFP